MSPGLRVAHVGLELVYSCWCHSFDWLLDVSQWPDGGTKEQLGTIKDTMVDPLETTHVVSSCGNEAELFSLLF